MKNHSFWRDRESRTSVAFPPDYGALPWGTAPRYLLRDRDASYAPVFRTRVEGMGLEEIVIAPRSPWQNPYAERIIGSIRRECLDHVYHLQ